MNTLSSAADVPAASELPHMIDGKPYPAPAGATTSTDTAKQRVADAPPQMTDR
jgi:hypothetical protein